MKPSSTARAEDARAAVERFLSFSPSPAFQISPKVIERGCFWIFFVVSKMTQGVFGSVEMFEGRSVRCTVFVEFGFP